MVISRGYTVTLLNSASPGWEMSTDQGATVLWGSIYKISDDLSLDYLKSDLR